MNYIQRIQLEFCTVSLREDGIIESRFLTELPYEINPQDVSIIASAISQLSNGKQVAIINISGLNGTISPEARKVDFNNVSSHTLALALVIQELSQRLLANFYFKIKNVDYPVKTFKSEEEAIEWLKQQIHLRQKLEGQ